MGHEHSHNHLSSQVNYGTMFVAGIILNLLFIGAEVFYGYRSNSMALFADAGHNFSDVLALFLSWVAFIVSRKKNARGKTYGYRKVSVLASLVSGLLLIFTLFEMAKEAVLRFSTPSQVDGVIVIIVALTGVVINFSTAMLFMKGKESDLNIKGAFMHMITDALVSLGAAVSGFAILMSGWYWIDSLVSLFVVAIVLKGTISLLREAFILSIDGIPATVDIEKVQNFLIKQRNVVDLHDLHIWPLSTTETALTVHLELSVLPEDINNYLSEIEDELLHHFNIHHVTIQLEIAFNRECKLNNQYQRCTK